MYSKLFKTPIAVGSLGQESDNSLRHQLISEFLLAL
jgi:hypothetical protein